MPGATRLLRRPYLLAVSLAVAANLWSFRVSLRPVAYLYDAPVHEKMVDFAAGAISSGRLPFTAWFPWSGLGSAQFMHYQSLGAVLTGLVGTLTGAPTAFRLALFLLVGLWPFAVYSSARLLGMSRTASMFAALVSPLVVSYTGIGFERGAYSWTGGAEVWTQLFGMWLLPFAWAFTWRAMDDKRFVWLAAAASGLAFAFHFICGYLAFFGIMVMALVASRAWLARFARAALVLCGSLASAAWVIVPLLVFEKWSAINDVLAETPYVRGYGAGTELKWLFKGELFDARRSLAALSVLVLCGAIAAIVAWRAKPLGRALVCLFVACLLLSFGGTTWGPLIRLVPAHADLYFRRFSMGTQLAGVYLAGNGVVALWQNWARLVASFAKGKTAHRATFACFVAALMAWSFPAVRQVYRYDRSDGSTINAERAAVAQQGPLLAPLLGYVTEHGGGRVYPGQSSNWGGKLLVGYVPVYKYLLTTNVPESTYVVPTTSLMLGAEARFDYANPADYSLFGIRYLLLPTGISSPVPALEVMTSGPYALWEIPTGSYAELVRVTASLPANRADIGSESAIVLDTIGPGEDWAVKWPGGPKLPPISPATSAQAADLGVVTTVREDLQEGEISASADVRQTATLLFSVAFDPGWHAWVDGRLAPTAMLAPALVGVTLGPGHHVVVLRYVGYAWYPELWGFSALTLAGLALVGRRPGKKRRATRWVGRTWPGVPGPEST